MGARNMQEQRETLSTYIRQQNDSPSLPMLPQGDPRWMDWVEPRGSRIIRPRGR